jgi:hypothetical protein
MPLGSKLPEVTKRTILILKKANPEMGLPAHQRRAVPAAGTSRSRWDRHKTAANAGNRG